MYLYPISDVHLGMRKEFLNEKNILAALGFLNDYKDNIILCVCGDLGERYEGILWIQKVLSLFPQLRVVYTPGNHEFYGHNIDILTYDLYDIGQEIDRLFILDGKYIFEHVIDNIHFIGAPLWTDYNNNSSAIKNEVQRQLNDYRVITATNNFKLVTTERILTEHYVQKKNIFKKLEKCVGPSIVMTHHSPIILDVSRINNLTYAYCSDFTPIFDNLEKLPQYWLSGHTHQSHIKNVTFKKGSIQFISNQMGYPKELYSGYTSNCILEVKYNDQNTPKPEDG